MAKSVEQVSGVVRADVNFASGVMIVEYDPSTDPLERAVAIARSSGYGVEPLDARARVGRPDVSDARGRRAARAHELSVAAATLLIVAGWLLGRGDAEWTVSASVAAYAGAIAAGGWLIARRAVNSLRTRTLDMNVLMTVAVLGAAGIGEWAEGAAVVFLFSVGGMLESRSLARTRRSIRDLMDLSPPVARVVRGRAEEEVAVGDVEPGEVILVRPAERTPLDGVILAGASALDESPITGESVPVDKGEGDAVFAGSLNTTGPLEVRVTAAAEDSTLSRVIFMVEEAQAARAPSQQLVDRFSRVYTPAVIALAIVLAIVPPALSALTALSWGGFGEWFYRALVVLVVACPCALVISTPVSIVSAITRASRDGVLVKGGVHLENASRIRSVALDKTGTLTTGTPEVTDVVALDGGDAARVLEIAAALEAHSSHPLARAVVRAAGPHSRTIGIVGYEDVPGGGVRGNLDGVVCLIGSPAFLAFHGVADVGLTEVVERLEDDGRTVLALAEDGRATGAIGVADQVRAEATHAIDALLRGPIEHAVMLTGDNERTAAAVAAHAGVPEHRARLLPQDKAMAVRELQEAYGLVAMVGDGVNDAPALAASDLGIAMGAAGSDTALETADVALMSDDLAQLARFFDLGRRTVSVIRQNVVVSIGVKFAVLALAMTGSATLWMAVFADTGVSLLVTLNGMRLLASRP